MDAICIASRLTEEDGAAYWPGPSRNESLEPLPRLWSAFLKEIKLEEALAWELL